jgi:glutaredoxin-related protein
MCPAKTMQNLKHFLALKDREQPIQENLQPDG